LARHFLLIYAWSFLSIAEFRPLFSLFCFSSSAHLQFPSQFLSVRNTFDPVPLLSLCLSQPSFRSSRDEILKILENPSTFLAQQQPNQTLASLTTVWDHVSASCRWLYEKFVPKSASGVDILAKLQKVHPNRFPLGDWFVFHTISLGGGDDAKMVLECRDFFEGESRILFFPAHFELDQHQIEQVSPFFFAVVVRFSFRAFEFGLFFDFFFWLSFLQYLSNVVAVVPLQAPHQQATTTILSAPPFASWSPIVESVKARLSSNELEMVVKGDHLDLIRLNSIRLEQMQDDDGVQIAAVRALSPQCLLIQLNGEILTDQGRLESILPFCFAFPTWQGNILRFVGFVLICFCFVLFC
jgi:hypothetical protein